MKLTSWLLAFAGIGAAVGWLLYTDKGKEITRSTTDGVIDLSKKLSKLFEREHKHASQNSESALAN